VILHKIINTSVVYVQYFVSAIMQGEKKQIPGRRGGIYDGGA
jgi:hypothetical protein